MNSFTLATLNIAPQLSYARSCTLVTNNVKVRALGKTNVLEKLRTTDVKVRTSGNQSTKSTGGLIVSE